MEVCDEKKESSIDFHLRRFLLDFSANSTIHGIKYVFTEGKNFFTRIFWAAAVILACSASGYFLVEHYVKWSTNPDIGTRTENRNIREIPFPAITICPQTKMKMEFLNFRNTYRDYWLHFKLQGVSDADAARFESMLHVCEPELSFRLQLSPSKVTDGRRLVQTLKEISYSIDDTMLFCKFRNEIINCSSLFNEVVTPLGVCFSFNMVNYHELFRPETLDNDFDSYQHSHNSSWTLDGGYESEDINSHPFPIISQSHDALRVILKTTDIDLDYVCQGTNQGFKVFFHLPSNFPANSNQHLFVPIKHDVTVSMTAKVTKTSENLKSYEPRQRKCYMTNERPLKFFIHYTRNSCHLECYANFTLKTCGCVHFSMPRENSTQICDYSKLKCVLYARREMMLAYNTNNPGDLECNCLPSCTGIDYKFKNFQTAFDYQKLFDSYQYDLSGMPGVLMSRLTIYFQEPQFESTERYALYTFTDYIASCGGVLGLFMGFSILSLFELIYWLICWTSRITCHRHS